MNVTWMEKSEDNDLQDIAKVIKGNIEHSDLYVQQKTVCFYGTYFGIKDMLLNGRVY